MDTSEVWFGSIADDDEDDDDSGMIIDVCQVSFGTNQKEEKRGVPQK